MRRGGNAGLRVSDSGSDVAARVLNGGPPRAGSFIVTIYGDVVEPRGGTLWMGTLIEVCADHGISEGLVRTAVSRLVASGRLVGERQGRKSYYRLSDAAVDEFAHAARILFAAPAPARGWLFRFGGEALAPDLVSVGWAQASGYDVAPDRADLPRPPGLIFSATAAEGPPLIEFAARNWQLAPVADEYREFVGRFCPLVRAIGQGYRPDDDVSLALRLRLVHEYRRAVLSDPRLPADALPPDWPGPDARRLFVSLYLSLAKGADRHVGASFRDATRFLPAESAATAERVTGLRNESRPDPLIR